MMEAAAGRFMIGLEMTKTREAWTSGVIGKRNDFYESFECGRLCDYDVFLPERSSEPRQHHVISGEML
jgi:hypothetical protein